MPRVQPDNLRLAEPAFTQDDTRTRLEPRPRSAATLPIAGVPVRDTRYASLARLLHRRLDQNRKIAVGFVNQNFIITCRGLRVGRWVERGLILVNDGIGMQIAARLRFGRGFRENMNGTDFVPRFLTETQRPLSVFLIGSKPVVATRAASVIGDLPNCSVVGFCDGYSLWTREEAVLAEISAAAPDVLLVGLGNPLQERWVLKHWDRLDVRIIFGVGALFEWWSGYRRRAPSPIRQLRLEWLYRLMLEPRRLFRRYTVGILVFFALVLFRSHADDRLEAMS